VRHAAPDARRRGGRLLGTCAPCGAVRGSVRDEAPVWSEEARRKTGQFSNDGLTLYIRGGKNKSQVNPRRRLRPHSADDLWGDRWDIFRALKKLTLFVLGPYPLVKRELDRPLDTIIGSDRWAERWAMQFQSPYGPR